MRLAGMGFELAGAILGFTAVGYWLGKYFGNAALGIMIGASLGVIGGLYNLVRAALKVSREGEESRSSRAERNGR